MFLLHISFASPARPHETSIMARIPAAYKERVVKFAAADQLVASKTFMATTTLDPETEEFFVFRFESTVNLRTHPIVAMALDWIRRSENFVHSWPLTGGLGGVGPYVPHRARDYFFPYTMSTPPDSPELPASQPMRAKLRSLGVGITVKALYNSTNSFDSIINLEKATTATNELNALIRSNATELLVELYRFASQPTAAVRDAYLGALGTIEYRSTHYLRYLQGAWPYPAVEMFHHFCKLAACGVSDERIAELFDFLTDEADGGLPRAALLPLTRSTWRGFGDWLPSTGPIDHQQLLLDSSRLGQVSPLITFYLREHGYEKKRKSSCCFHPEAAVVMADGSTVPIGNVKPGDAVVTRHFGSGAVATATVLFRSEPGRHGRKLYEMHDMPGIYFTAAHPLVTRGGAVPLLSFVDVDLAKSLNPTWASLYTSPMPKDSYRLAGELVNGDVSILGQSLNDLVLQPQEGHGNDVPSTDGPMTFFLRSSNGQDLEVACEVPIIAWYPYTAMFFSSFIDQVGVLLNTSRPGALADIWELISPDDVALERFIDYARPEAWSQCAESNPSMHWSSVAAPPSLVDILTGVPEEVLPQAAEILDVIIPGLGRSIDNMIQMAWVYEPVDGRATKPYLVLHELVLPSCFLPDWKTPLGSSETVELEIIVKQTDSEVGRVKVDGHMEGRLMIEIQTAVSLDIPYTAGQKAMPELQVEIPALGLSGVCELVEMVSSTVSLARDGHSTADPVPAVLKAQLRRLSPDRVTYWQDSEAGWREGSRVRFAQALGRGFASALDTVLGDAE